MTSPKIGAPEGFLLSTAVTSISTSNERRKRHTDQNVRPISDRAVAIFFAILVAILVLGYLLMTKLADDSRAENCMMARRKNCGAIEWPSN
jgi:hypothetical protein